MNPFDLGYVDGQRAFEGHIQDEKTLRSIFSLFTSDLESSQYLLGYSQGYDNGLIKHLNFQKRFNKVQKKRQRQKTDSLDREM